MAIVASPHHYPQEVEDPYPLGERGLTMAVSFFNGLIFAKAGVFKSGYSIMRVSTNCDAATAISTQLPCMGTAKLVAGVAPSAVCSKGCASAEELPRTSEHSPAEAAAASRTGVSAVGVSDIIALE